MMVTIGYVIAIFRDYLRLGRYWWIYDLMDTLLADYLCDDVDYVLQPASISRWMSGERPVSPRITGYYCRAGGDAKMARTICRQLLPCMPDHAAAVEDIVSLVETDPTIHPRTRDDLLAGYPCRTMEDEAILMARVVVYAMARRTVAELQYAA